MSALAPILARLQPPQAGQIPLEHADFSQGGPDALEHRGPHAVQVGRDGVVTPLAILAHRDQSGPLEVNQVTGNPGLRQSQHFAQVADADFSFQQEIEKTDAALVGQSPEHGTGGLEGRCHIRLGGYVIDRTTVRQWRK